MLSYIDKGEGIPIVLIHGLGSRKEAWKPQLALADKYRLVIPDLRGHGETTLDTDISVPNFASDVVELLEVLGISSAYICGLSLGGIVAQEIYKQSPHIVKGLILANTSSYIDPFFAQMVVKGAINDYRDKDFIDLIVDRSLHNKEFTEEAKGAFLIRDSYIQSATAPIGLNYFLMLPTVNVPVMLIGGTHDTVTPLANLWCTKMFLSPFTKVRILQNTGHLSNIDNREQFNQELDEFIGGQ